MSVREWLIKTLSHRENIPTNVISAVVSHQYEGAAEAMKSNNSIEISGFGKFYFNEKKAHKQMARLLDQEATYKQVLADEGITEKKRLAVQEKLAIVEKSLKTLKTKNNE